MEKRSRILVCTRFYLGGTSDTHIRVRKRRTTTSRFQIELVSLIGKMLCSGIICHSGQTPHIHGIFF